MVTSYNSCMEPIDYSYEDYCDRQYEDRQERIAAERDEQENVDDE